MNVEIDGRTLVAHDAGGDGLALIWHHGSPQTGALLDPLVDAARARGMRLISYGRPSYGGSSANVGRNVASAARDCAAVADALGVGQFAVMGASGGGPHALACGALLGARVVGVVCLASLAPRTDAFDWFDGMIGPGGLRAAASGRGARARFADTETFDPDSFTAADWASLEGPWRSLGVDAGRAGSEGLDGLIDDDVAFAAPWGFEPSDIAAPVLIIHGGEDRVVPLAHAEWLVRACPVAELWLRPRDGHVSVLDACPVAMDWLLDTSRPATT